MTTTASLASVAALIGDPARAAVLVTLMDGRALTAGELAGAAGVAPSTASGHLVRLLEAGLLALERQGRHRYYRIASPSVAGLSESLMSVSGELSAATAQCRPVRTGPRDIALRRARLCYDHLAGQIGVGIAAGLIARGRLSLGQDGGTLTQDGAAFLASIGVELRPDGSAERPCRACLDWSERRLHVAGQVGRALYRALLRADWVRKPIHGRAVAVTPLGARQLDRHFGITPV